MKSWWLNTKDIKLSSKVLQASYLSLDPHVVEFPVQSLMKNAS